jgi:eukaryotic-like serine/threonine-protein kinase
VLLVIAIGLGAFAIGYGITTLAFSRGAAPSDVVMVPDVRELTVADATRRMDRVDLGLTVGDSFPNPVVAEGAILAQSPLPGQEVSPGTEVRVILSTGQPRPTVPDVEAMPLALATRALNAAGFDVLVDEAPGEGQPGRVVDVDPPAGTPVRLPASVLVRVGAAASGVEMPHLIGMHEEVARAIVESVGMLVDEVFYDADELGEPGSVVGQEPAPGDRVGPGTGVRLRVVSPAPAAWLFRAGGRWFHEAGRSR